MRCNKTHPHQSNKNNLTFKEAYLKFTRNSTPLLSDLDFLTFKSLINLSVDEYLRTNIDGINRNCGERDILSFECSNYYCNDNQPKIKLSIKRKVFIENSDKDASFGFSIHCSSLEENQFKSFLLECSNKNLVDRWKLEIEKSNYLEKIKSLNFLKIEFELQKPTYKNSL